MARLTVGDVCAALDRLYPPSLAEDWDRNGLCCGDPDAPVSGVLLAVDLTDDVITEASSNDCNLIVTHHPLLLRGIHSVSRATPKGRRLLALITGNISAFNVHTPADSAPGGVSDAVAEILGLVGVRPLDPRSRDDSLSTSERLAARDGSAGIGRVGSLPVPMPARDLAARLASRLPQTVAGIKIGGDPDRTVARVAILAGAGDSHLDAARIAAVDAFITSDLRHHPAEEALAWETAPVLIDVPHWACEWAWLPHAAASLVNTAQSARPHEPTRGRSPQSGVLQDAFSDLRVQVSTLRTEPWSLRL